MEPGAELAVASTALAPRFCVTRSLDGWAQPSRHAPLARRRWHDERLDHRLIRVLRQHGHWLGLRHRLELANWPAERHEETQSTHGRDQPDRQAWHLGGHPSEGRSAVQEGRIASSGRAA